MKRYFIPLLLLFLIPVAIFAIRRVDLPDPRSAKPHGPHDLTGAEGVPQSAGPRPTTRPAGESRASLDISAAPSRDAASTSAVAAAPVEASALPSPGGGDAGVAWVETLKGRIRLEESSSAMLPDESSNEFRFRVAQTVLSLAKSGRADEIISYLDHLAPGIESSLAVTKSVVHLASTRWDAPMAEKEVVMNTILGWFVDSNLDTPESIAYRIGDAVEYIAKQDRNVALNAILALEGRIEAADYAYAMMDVHTQYAAAGREGEFMEILRQRLSPESFAHVVKRVRKMKESARRQQGVQDESSR